MKDKENVSVEEVNEAAAPNTKTELLAQVMRFAGSMKKAELEDFVKNFSDAISDGAAAQNMASIAMKPSDASASVKEDVEELFSDSEDLSEEFKDKASTLFEAAVTNRVEMLKAELEEAFEEQYEEKLTESIDQLHENIDSYLNHVAEKWIEENRATLETNYRSELSESFLAGMKKLFEENYVEVPEEKIDVLENLQTRVDELVESLEKVQSENIELRSVISEAKREAVLDDLTEDLTDTQVEKLRKLSENVEYNDAEDYKAKVEMIKEQYFSDDDSSNSDTGLINEDASIGLDNTDEAETIPAHLRPFVDAISRTVKK